MAYDGTLKFDTSMDTSGFQKDANSLGNIVKGLGAFKIIEQGFQAITASIDKAVSRYDTLNRFPKIMEQMGFSADETDTAMRRLSDGVQGLPTALDSITGAAQRIASMTGDLVGAADLTLALNNAFLASGASADTASRGMEQYMQIISRGKPEMEDWKTLQETMPYALQKVAESFGFAGTSATRDFYAALQNGEITVEQMNARFIELSTTTGGFADTARTATGGIGTAWQNLKTGMVRGVANIVDAIDTGLSKTRFKSIENVVQNMGKGIEAVLGAVAKAFGFVAEHIEPITVAVVSFGVAWKGVQLLSYVGQLGSVTAAIKAMTPALLSNVAAKVADKAETLALIAMYAKDAVVKGLSTAATAANAVAAKASAAADGGSLIAKIALAAATGIATAAQWALNAAMSANPIGLVIAAVVALVAALVGLIAWLGKGSAAYEEQKKEIEELSEAHEEYEAQLAEDQKTAKQAIAKTQAQAEANAGLVDSLRTLINTNDDAGKNNEAIAQTVDQLNSAVEGMGLTYDENTGALSANIDELEKYVDAHGQLSVIQAQEEEYNRLLGEQLDLQAKIRVEEERKNILAQQLEDGLITQREYNDLIRKTDDLIADYSETEQQLATDIQAAHAAIDRSAQDSAQAQVNAFEAVNGALDSEGRNLKQLALLYGMTTDQILAEMQEQGLSMADWSEKKASMFTEEGQSLQGVANQWGMTTDEVLAHMDEWGMSLDEFAQHMEDTHTKEGLSLDDLAAKWGTTAEAIKTEMDNMGISMQEWSDQQDQAWADYEEAVKEHTAGVVNGFEEIPAKFEKSAQEMLDILIANKERYAEWESTMEEITRQLGPVAAEEFRQLGPEATSAMQEILGSAELLDQYREVFGVKVDEATGMAVENWNDPNFIGAPSTAIDTSAQQVTENSALTTAVTTQMENAKTAAEAIDFSAVGQNIAADIANGLNSANVSGAMNTIASTVQSGAGRVTSSVSSMSSSVQSTLRTMSSQSQSIATQMMTQINSAVVSRASTIKSSITSMGNGITTALNTAKTQAVNITTQMMTQINSAIVSRQATIKASMPSCANGVITALTDMKTKGGNLATQMMTQINTAIVTKTATVKSSATTLENGVVSALEAMVSGGKSAADRMMDGMLSALTNKASSLYAKAREIANRIAATLEDAWDEHSPSRVSYRIMEFFMRAMYNAMGDMSGLLYTKADSVADGLTDRLTLEPGMFTSIVDKLRSVTEANPLGGAALVPQAAYAGGGGGTSYVTSLTQNITTPKPLSASEMTREGQDLLRRSRWQLP